jgi:hypothetical protein
VQEAMVFPKLLTASTEAFSDFLLGRQTMFGAIIAAFSNILDAKRHTSQLASLEKAVSQLQAEHGRNQQTIAEISGILQQHERRLLYLEMWKECQGDCLQMIKDLGNVQEDQKRRVRNLEETIEDDILPSLDVLKGIAATDKEKQEVRNMQSQLTKNLNLAKEKVGLN